jgi:hypothetical protein
MIFRRATFAFWTILLVMSGFAAPLSAAPASETLARVHWMGLKQIGTDPNAAQFMKVWQLPQTTALVAQTLGKVSRLPGHGVTNAASVLILPLLDDLVSSEFYLEADAPAGFPLSARPTGGEGRGEVDLNSQIANCKSKFLLALHLPAARASLWQANLAAAMEKLYGVKPVPTATGWRLQQANAPQCVEFARHGEWTLIALGPDTNALSPDFAARLVNMFPLSARQTAGEGHGEVWLQADLNPARLAGVFSLSARQTGEEGRGEVAKSSIFRLPPSAFLSQVSSFKFQVSGDAGAVLTRATAGFSRPLDLRLTPWEIPTNFIHGPLTSFTALRGIARWLTASPAWKDLQLTNAPDQAFCWAQTQPNSPFATYFAAPLPDAAGQLRLLAARLAQHANPWLATNGQSSFEWNDKLPGLAWNNIFIMSPFLMPVSVNHRDFVLGGLIPYYEGNPNPPPSGILQALLDTPGLVYYEAEQTGDEIEDGLFITQALRLTFNKPQLPAKAAATLWLKNVEPLLAGSTTEITQTGPQQLVLKRKSAVGFTAPELHLLADWLESPQFPHGLHTFLAPPDHP